MPSVYRKLFTEETEEELLNMTRTEASLNLNDKQRAFCEYYIVNYNIKLAAIKAGYSPKAAHTIGWKLRQDPDVNRYLAWLKLRVGRECHVHALDVLDQYIRIAFADVTDFVEIKNGKTKLTELEKIDGQLVKKIKQHKDGTFTIELQDKMAALQKLERYFDIMPKDWRQDIEERKLEIAQERLEVEKIKVGLIEEKIEDDGFIEALMGEAESVWEEEEVDDNEHEE